MKNTISTTTLFIFCFLLFVSCGTEKPCNTTPPTLAFIKYKPDEIDSITILKIIKNSSPLIILDSVLVSLNNAYYSSAGDTIFINNYSDQILTSNFDWQININSNQAIFNLADIVTEGRKQKCGGLLSLDCFPCSDPIKSFSLGGQQVIFTNEKVALIIIRK